jgi:hypothetical protein
MALWIEAAGKGVHRCLGEQLLPINALAWALGECRYSIVATTAGLASRRPTINSGVWAWL